MKLFYQLKQKDEMVFKDKFLIYRVVYIQYDDSRIQKQNEDLFQEQDSV